MTSRHAPYHHPAHIAHQSAAVPAASFLSMGRRSAPCWVLLGKLLLWCHDQRRQHAYTHHHRISQQSYVFLFPLACYFPACCISITAQPIVNAYCNMAEPQVCCWSHQPLVGGGMGGAPMFQDLQWDHATMRTSPLDSPRMTQVRGTCCRRWGPSWTAALGRLTCSSSCWRRGPSYPLRQSQRCKGGVRSCTAQDGWS
jgi:hypothetical protein